VDLVQYARERDALFRQVIQVLETDQRVNAAWLSGSYGRREADEWSDLDLHLAVDDTCVDQFLDERQSLYSKVGRPILVQEDMASNSQTGARFQLVMYSGPIEVDWNIGPVSLAERPLSFQMLVERIWIPIMGPAPLAPNDRRAQAQRYLTFFWAMAPIAIKSCGRGDTRRAVLQIDLLTTAYIALWRLVGQPAGPNPVLHPTNRILESELDAQIPPIGPTITPESALVAIDQHCQEVLALHTPLKDLGAVVSNQVPMEVTRLQEVAREDLRRGGIRRRAYR